MARWFLVAILAACATHAAAAGWYDVDYDRRIKITCAPDSIGTGVPDSLGADYGSLIGFPLLLTDLPAAVYDSALTTGADLRFTAQNGTTLLPHEIVYYNATTDSCEIWVRVGTLTPSFNWIYLYYDNADATPLDLATTQSTWQDYEVVYHFDNNPALGMLLDSSPNARDANAQSAGAQSWDADDRVDSPIRRGWHYNQNVNTAYTGVLTTSLDWSVFAWVEMDTFGTDFLVQGPPCVQILATGASDVSHDIQYTTGGYCGSISQGVDFRYRGGDGTQDDFHHYAFAMSSEDSLVTVYYDGREFQFSSNGQAGERVKPSGLGQAGAPIGLGSVQYLQDGTGTLTDSMHGTVDELHVRAEDPNLPLGAHFYSTLFRNQATPATFVSFATQEACWSCD